MKNLSLFIVLVVLTILITVSIDILFVDDQVFYRTYGEQLTLSRIDDLLTLSKRYKWLAYLFIPIGILCRVFYTSVFLYIGLFFIEVKTSLGTLFKISLAADIVFVLSAFTKLVLLIFFREVGTLEDLQFQPFSVMELLDKNVVDPVFIYPLSLLNIFELGYFLVLGLLLGGVMYDLNDNLTVHFRKSLTVVISSYGTGLLIWVVFILFVNLNLS